MRTSRIHVLGLLLAGFLLGSMPADVGATTNRDVQSWRFREITFGLYQYWEKHGRLPKDIHDKHGKPLLSWRVQLLPYLPELDTLYQQFDLDEPWDSPHNPQFIAPTLTL